MCPNAVPSIKTALFMDGRRHKPSVVHKTVDFKVAYIEGQVYSCLAIFSTASRQLSAGRLCDFVMSLIRLMLDCRTTL